MPIDKTNVGRLELLFSRDFLWEDGSYDFAQVSPDGNLLAFAQGYGPLRILQLPWTSGDSILPLIDSTAIRTYDYHTRSIAFSPDSSLLALADTDDDVVIIDLTNQGRGATLAPIEWPTSAVFTEDGTKLIVGTMRGFEGAIQLWDLEGPSLLREISTNAPSGGVCSLAVSPDGHTLASGYCTYIFDVSTWTIRAGYTALSRLVGLDEVPYCIHFCDELNRNIIVFSPSGQYVASGTNWSRIPLQDPFSGKLRGVIDTTRPTRDTTFANPSPVNGLAFTHDSSIIAIAAANELQLRDPTNGDLLWHEEKQWETSISAVAITPDSRLLISVDSLGQLEFWGVPSEGTS